MQAEHASSLASRLADAALVHEAALGNQRQQVHVAQQDAQDAKQQWATAAAELASTRAEADRLQVRVQELVEQLAASTAAGATLQARVEALRGEGRAVEQGLQTRVEELSADVVRLQADLEAANKVGGLERCHHTSKLCVCMDLEFWFLQRVPTP
jgi:uncharacterized protein (DUF3084 family)